MDAAQVLLIVIGLLNVALLSVLVWKLHKLQASLPRGFGRKVLRSLRHIKMAEWGIGWPTPHDPHDEVAWRARAIEYFVFWQWSNGAWKHRPESLPKGADPGPSPAHPGAYDGQVIKTWVGRKR